MFFLRLEIKNNKEAIEYIEINNHRMNNIYLKENDKYGLYRSTREYKISEGITIDIKTNENNKILELRGIEMLVNAISDV